MTASTAFANTRAAARYAVGHSAGLTAYRAAVLARWARACERAVSDGDRQLHAVSRGLMRDLVLAVRELVGGAWLAASGDDPDVAAFNALETVAVPPRRVSSTTSSPGCSGRGLPRRPAGTARHEAVRAPAARDQAARPPAWSIACQGATGVSVLTPGRCSKV